MPTSLGETTSVYVPPQRIRPESADGERAGSGLWDKDGFSFGDFLDVINPLQHIPIISSLYRRITGDDIGQVPRVIGGALFGGPIGFFASLLNAIVDEETGKDVGEHAIAMLFGGDEADSPPGDTPGTITVATASAFSPINDAIFDDEAAPVPPAADTPPVMLAAVITPMNDSEFASADVPPPPAPPPDSLPEFARPAVTVPVVAPAAALETTATAAPAVARAPAAVPPAASLVARSLAARPAAVLAALMAARAEPVPPAAPANGEAGDETAQANTETTNAKTTNAKTRLRSALLPHFSGGADAARPGPWVSQAMMYGLERYEAMARERMRAKPDIDRIF